MAKRKEIAIIGGGLGGCLTALMLAKNPKYHITLIEADNAVLNGASLLASRLHLGGEYPLDQDTARDCLEGATIWKMLMPGNIYTPTPRMKFLVAQDTEEEGQLTLAKYGETYNIVNHLYGDTIRKVITETKKRVVEAEEALFGPVDQFLRKLEPEEYDDYHRGFTRIAGGFQSLEMGLNVPKYLAMIQHALETNPNITIRTGCKIAKNGIGGKLGAFTLRNDNDELLQTEDHQPLKFDNVLLAGWQGNPEITPHLGQDRKGNQKTVTVYKRAMLLVNLPSGWKTSPAFIMLGEHGGMLAPYNDDVAICYLPHEEAAYRKDHKLTDVNSSLPADWDDLFDIHKDIWTRRYFDLLKQRFPILREATNPRLLIRHTLSFQQDLSERQHETVKEVEGPAAPVQISMGFHLRQVGSMNQEQRMEPQLRLEAEPYIAPLEVKDRPGLFTLYPTKATYGVRAAIQATRMIDERSRRPKAKHITPESNTLDLVLKDPDRYSLAGMKDLDPVQDREIFVRFFKEHPDLEGYGWKIMENTWPSDEPDKTTPPNEPRRIRERGGSNWTR